MVRYLLAVLLAVLLPLQLAWGVVAPYCEHEETVTAQHPGHHSHEHEAPAQDDNSGKKPLVDADCGVCHASMAAVVPVLEPAIGLPSSARMPPALGDLKRASAPQALPDRPQWPRLA